MFPVGTDHVVAGLEIVWTFCCNPVASGAGLQAESQAYVELLKTVPVACAALYGTVLAVYGITLPTSLMTVTQQLAMVHAPLALLSFGLVAEHWTRQFRSSRQADLVVACRHVPALLVGAALALAGSQKARVVLPACMLASLGEFSRLSSLQNSQEARKLNARALCQGHSIKPTCSQQTVFCLKSQRQHR